MKFLCVPCDTPMKLQSVGPPDRGSLSVVYSCPECGYEMAMLTNAYETQVVQSLGVRIGPADASAEAAATTSGCPFSAMLPAGRGSGLSLPAGARSAEAGARDSANDPEPQGQVAAPVAVRWTAAAEARLANIPSFVRPMARTGIEQFARERGVLEVDEQILNEARDFFGM